MRTRPLAILAVLALVAGSAFAAAPAFAAGHEGSDRPDGEPRALSRGSVILDGVRFELADLKHFSGPLTWVATREGSEDGTIHAFTSPAVAKVFMRQVMERDFGIEALTAGSIDCAPGYPPYYQWHNDWSVFNKDVGCGGAANLAMHSGQQYANLDFDGWNNRISCVKAACIPAWTVLYACRFFDMTADSNCEDPDVEYIQPGLIVYDLNQRSFNNSTSSIRFE